MNWEDIKVFLSVANRGSLSGAVAELRLSPPTIGRRLTRLERSLGVTLFVRRHDGYRLTEAGEDLIKPAQAMEQAARSLDRQASARSERARASVRIASGFWFSRLITSRLADFQTQHPSIELEFVTGHALADLDCGEADISIRNVRPAEGDWVMRKLAEAPFALYGSEAYVAAHPEALDERRYSACDWIGAAPSLQHLASQRWLQAKIKKEPVLKCSQTLQFLDAAKADAGLAILPQMVGDGEAGLRRVSDPIELDHNEVWLVIHEDLRKAPAIRAVADWLVALFRKQG